MRGEPPLSSSEVELAELMERFHVNAAKYSSLIFRDSLCSMVLLLKNTLITLLSHTLTFTALRVKSRSGERGFGELDRPKGKGSLRETVEKIRMFLRETAASKTINKLIDN